MTDMETEFGKMRIGINASLSAVLIEFSDFAGNVVTVGITADQAMWIIAAISAESLHVIPPRDLEE